MSIGRLWYGEGNCALDDVSDSAHVAKSILFAIKALVVGTKTGTNGINGAVPAGAKYLHDQSCDSASVSTTVGPGGDLWTGTFDATKIVRNNAGVHSWWVGKCPTGISAIGVPFYFGMDYNGGGDGIFTMFWSKTRPTGGTTSARPTAADEWVLSGSSSLSDLTAAAHRCHWITDANGGSFILFSRNGKVHTAVIPIMPFEGPESSDVFPVCGMIISSTTTRGAFDASQEWISPSGKDSNFGIHMRSPSGSVVAGNGEGNGIAPFGPTGWHARTTVNEGSGKLDRVNCLVNFYNSSPPTGAVRGAMPDWKQVNSAKAIGSFDPISGTAERVIVGNAAVPCAGIALLF